VLYIHITRCDTYKQLCLCLCCCPLLGLMPGTVDTRFFSLCAICSWSHRPINFPPHRMMLAFSRHHCPCLQARHCRHVQQMCLSMTHWVLSTRTASQSQPHTTSAQQPSGASGKGGDAAYHRLFPSLLWCMRNRRMRQLHSSRTAFSSRLHNARPSQHSIDDSLA